MRIQRDYAYTCFIISSKSFIGQFNLFFMIIYLSFLNFLVQKWYDMFLQDLEFEPMDTCISSVLGIKCDLSDMFKKHYKLWLEQEVYNVSVNWEKLLDPRLIDSNDTPASAEPEKNDIDK